MHQRITGLILGAALAGFSLLAGSANATDLPSVVCDNCTNAQMDGKALQFARAQPIGVPQIYYVFNPTADIAYKYQVLRDYDGGDLSLCGRPGSAGNTECQVRAFVSKLTIEPQIAAMNEAIRLAGTVQTIKIPNTSGYPATPFDDMQLINNQLRVDEAIRANAVAKRISDIIYAARAFGKLEAEATFSIQYSDGGSSRYGYNPISGRWEPIVGSYYDQAGNRIPQNQAQVAGENPNVTIIYGFNTATTITMTRFAQQLEGIGIPVTGVPSPSNRTIICWTEWATNSVTVHCRYGS